MEQEGPARQRWRARVIVTLKPVVNDPQGLAIRDGLHQLGYAGVQEVRAGKIIDVRLVALAVLLAHQYDFPRFTRSALRKNACHYRFRLASAISLRPEQFPQLMLHTKVCLIYSGDGRA